MKEDLIVYKRITYSKKSGTVTIYLPGCDKRCTNCHRVDMIDSKSGIMEGVRNMAIQIAEYNPRRLAICGGEPLVARASEINTLLDYLDCIGNFDAEIMIEKCKLTAENVRNPAQEGADTKRIIDRTHSLLIGSVVLHRLRPSPLSPAHAMLIIKQVSEATL